MSDSQLRDTSLIIRSEKAWAIQSYSNFQMAIACTELTFLFSLLNPIPARFENLVLDQNNRQRPRWDFVCALTFRLASILCKGLL